MGFIGVYSGLGFRVIGVVIGVIGVYWGLGFQGLGFRVGEFRVLGFRV